MKDGWPRLWVNEGEVSTWEEVDVEVSKWEEDKVEVRMFEDVLGGWFD